MTGRTFALLWSTLLSGALPALSAPLSAQSGAGGTVDEDPQFLLLAVGAKAVSLGRAVTASAGPESVWWNPAGLGEVEGNRFVLYRGEQVLPATGGSLLLSRPALGLLGLSYQLLDLGTQDLTDSNNNVIGQITIGGHIGVLSVATRLRDQLNVGVNLKTVQLRVTCRGECSGAGATTRAVAVDAGAQITSVAGLPLRLGIMIANTGSEFQISGGDDGTPLPTRVRMAVSYEVLGHFIESDELKLLLGVELEDRAREPGTPVNYFGTELVAGTEDKLYLRAGYVLGAEQQLDGAAVGVGLQYERFELALAKSFATSALSGDSEPVHISFGLVF